MSHRCLSLAFLTLALAAPIACGGAPFQAGAVTVLVDAASTPTSEALEASSATSSTESGTDPTDSGPPPGDTSPDPDSSSPSSVDGGTGDAATCTPLTLPLASPCAGGTPITEPGKVWEVNAGVCFPVDLPPQCACTETFNCRCLLNRAGAACMQGAGCFDGTNGGTKGDPFVTCS